MGIWKKQNRGQGLIYDGCSEPVDPLIKLSAVPECVTGIDILGNWCNSHMESLACEVRVTVVENTSGLKPLKFPSHS